MNHDHMIDKRQVRKAFDRAAASYDQAAVLQREVLNRMLSRLDYIKYSPSFIMDAGSGTGHGTRELAARYPDARVLALDIAPAMHLHARASVSPWKRLLGAWKNQTGYVIGDIEQLPIKTSSVQLVWSNLTLQWCNDIKQTIGEIHRVLQTNGLFMFSTFGPDTLKELRHAFDGIDQFSHINRFIDMHDIGDMLVHNGFATPVMDMEYITMTYQDVPGMMRDLKAIGAHNVTHGRRRGLTGKAAWREVTSRYEKARVADRLPATFEVVYGHAWKPQPRTPIVTPELRRQLGLI
ncbi:MAG TPA: malonyl-ACP O-methyltransferase BioC [Nitrosospira sp.]|jgi:malonyl-CoA O-methyltransferase|nr:malonyl-ACP O-methyltransferase BioC [Nitrosospira sp.]